MTDLPANNDFLSQNTNKEDSVKKKRRTSLEVEMDKFPEYYSLTEYQRKCLVATNYFRVLYGLCEIPVPPSDEHYYKYFDNKCYERSEQYKKTKQREFDFKEKFSKLTFSKKQSDVIENEPARQDNPNLAQNETTKDNGSSKEGTIGHGRKQSSQVEEKKVTKKDEDEQLNLF